MWSQQQLPRSSRDFSLQPVHQRCDQSLLAVVGGEDQQHGVPGQIGQSGGIAGLSGGERIFEDHSWLDRGDGPQQVLSLSIFFLPEILFYL